MNVNAARSQQWGREYRLSHMPVRSQRTSRKLCRKKTKDKLVANFIILHMQIGPMGPIGLIGPIRRISKDQLQLELPFRTKASSRTELHAGPPFRSARRSSSR